MKNILFATTALVATAGIASADVSVSGFAEMGVADNGNGDMQYHTDFDVSFGMSGETDGGLTFGASIDLDEAGGLAATGTAASAAFISGAFGKVTLGDTDDALDWAMDEALIGGGIADDNEHGGYSGNGYLAADGQVLRYEYSMANMSFAVSAEQGADGASGSDDIMSVGVKTSFDMAGTSVAVGAGFIDNGTANGDGFGVSAKAGFGDVTAIVSMADVADVEYTGVALGYTMDALTIGVNFNDIDAVGTANDVDGYGFAVNYDLGGGAVVQVAYGDTDADGTANDVDKMSIGLALSF